MRHFITKAPAEGDCFFHVVAYFLNGDINDPRAAQEIRRGLARQAAKDLFDMTLENLTKAVLNSGGIEGLPPVINEPQAQILQNSFNNGPAQDANNGNNCPIAVFVVWLQLSRANIAKYRKYFRNTWLRKNYKFGDYTLWGDDQFTIKLTTRRYGKECLIFFEDTLDEIDQTHDNAIRILYSNDPPHFDAITFEDDGAEEEEPVPQPSGSESIDPHPDNVCLEIHHLDVAQGDSTLILVRDAGSVVYSALVDGGKKGRAEMIHNYMAKVGIISLDVMVVTHFDQDHALGAFHLLALSPLCNHTLLVDRGEIFDKDREKLRNKSLLGETDASNKNENFSVEFESDLHEFNQWWRPRSTKRTMLSGDDALGRYIFDISGPEFIISLQCIAVNGNVLGDRYVQPMHSDRENGMSLCLLLRFNEFYYFLGGDAPGVSGNNLEGAVADWLMDDLELDHVCGLKVSHHGSAQSTSASFIGKIKPTCAFISCGTEFCFPRPQVLANLLNQKTIQNIYLSRCIFQREGITPHNKIQTGTARVAGDENTMGTIVLRMDASMADNHIFHVGYWDREQGAWKSIRHCCGYDELNEEIVNTQLEDYEDDEMLITPCRKQDIQEETKEDEAEEENSEENEAEPDLIEMLDATESLRAAKDCENVRSIGVNEREAMRSTELDDEKRSSKQQQESKTIETQEMIDELDNEYEIEMDQKEKEEYEDDEEYIE